MISTSSIELQGPALGEPTESVPPLPLHQLPTPPGDFIGRTKEFDELVENVRFGGVDIVGLYGMAGVGKTVLALKVAEELTPRYPDAQFYVDLKGTGTQPLSSTEAMARVVRAYDPRSELSRLDTEVEAMYRSVLTGRRAILLMDNAANREQVLPLIPPEGCLLMITSRHHFALPGMAIKNLDTMSVEDARELLLRIAPRIGDSADAMARLCGRHPLALRRAASMLAEHRDIATEEYLRRLSHTGERLALVDVSFALSYAVLTPVGQRQWRMLSVFPDYFTAADAAEIWGLEMSAAQGALSTLLSSNMLEWSDGHRQYRMHELMRLWAEACCSEEERTLLQQKLAEHGAMVLSRASACYLQGGEGVQRGLALFDSERGTIEAGWSWAVAHAEENEQAAELCVRYPVAGAEVLRFRHTPRERMQWLHTPLAMARRLNDRHSEAVLLGNLGTVHYHLGETHRAIEYHTQALAVAREEANRNEEARALGHLGLAYSQMGEARRAIEYHEKALEIARETGDRRAEGECLGQLAAAKYATGDVQRSIELCEHGLAIALAVGDRRAESDHLGSLAAAYYALGETRRALDLGSQSLLITREIGDRREEGNVLEILGRSHAALGDVRRSIECHQAHLAITRELSDRSAEGDALGNLGNAYARSGDARRALECYQEHLKLVRDTGDRRAEAAVLGNIGKAHARLGETRIAIERHAEQLRIARELGDRHEEGTALWNTSLALDKLGDRLQAITHADAASAIFENAGDVDGVRVRKQLEEWMEKSKAVARGVN